MSWPIHGFWWAYLTGALLGFSMGSWYWSIRAIRRERDRWRIYTARHAELTKHIERLKALQRIAPYDTYKDV